MPTTLLISGSDLGKPVGLCIDTRRRMQHRILEAVATDMFLMATRVLREGAERSLAPFLRPWR